MNQVTEQERCRGQGVSGELRIDEPMSHHTSWRVGGTADRLFLPAGSEDLVAYLAGLPSTEPLFWLGLGSNLLVRDGGLRGTVICTKGRLKHMHRLDPDRVYAESGVASAQVAKFCAENGFVGAEFLAGIPGTLGGALAMNAGAFGGETWNVVDRVKTVDRYGRIRWRTVSEFEVGYRTVQGLNADEFFLGAELRLARGDAERVRRQIRELLARRAASQPTNVPSCGSTFRNPPGNHAGRLIEAAGLKGYRIGGAEVSCKHANFIINTGDATAADIERLILYVQAEVSRVHGVTLNPEVRVVGESFDVRNGG